ncbi:unnamed protein product, partial [Effrenium voratum]
PEAEAARRLAAWILDPNFHQIRSPPLKVDLPKKRQRGKRKSARAQAAVAGPKRPAQRTSASSRLWKVGKGLVEPLQVMLQRGRTLGLQELLSKRCPSKHALIILKTFEGAKTISGKRCTCQRPHSAPPPAREGARSRSVRCSGGAAELRFLRAFPVLRCAVPGRQVGDFLVEALARLGAEELLGRRTWRRLAPKLQALVDLRRGEELSVHQLLQGLPVRDFQHHLGAASGAPLRDAALGAEVLGRLCYFLFAHLAVPLLKGHFYVTEAEVCGARAVYFRKHVWHFLRSRADCGFLHLCMDAGQEAAATTFSAASSRRMPQTGASTGPRPPVVRWVPKKKGLRPIVNMARWAAFQGQTPREQRQVLAILAQLRATHPEVLGNSLLSQHEVHPQLVEAMAKLFPAGAQGAEGAELFVGVADLRNCYDKLPHRELLKSISQLPLLPRYQILQVSLRPPGSRPPRLLEVALPEGQALPALLAPRAFGAARPAALRTAQAVLLPRQGQQMARADVCAALRAAVQRCSALLGTQPNQEKGGRRFVRGIPQGSRFAPFLCAMHMSRGDRHLPAEVLQSIAQNQTALVRLVDDFLFIGKDTPQHCCRFFSSLARASNPYNGELNLSKCGANFSWRFESAPEPRFVPSKRRRLAGVEVPWAGLTLAPEGRMLNVGHLRPPWKGATEGLSLKGRRGPGFWQNIFRSRLLNFLSLGVGADDAELRGLCRRGVRAGLRGRRSAPAFAAAYAALGDLPPRQKRLRRVGRFSMDHMVAHVVDLSLRTYRACQPDSLAASSLAELLLGLGYVVRKGDLAGIPWKDWRAFRREEAFHKNTSFLKALLAAAFSEHLLVGGYGPVPKDLDGASSSKILHQLEDIQREMEKQSFHPRETVVFPTDAVEDPESYVEFVCGSQGKAVKTEPKEVYTLVNLSGLEGEATRWHPLNSRASAPLLVSKSRFPAEFNLLVQFEKHMRELQKARAGGWTHKPVPMVHPHLLKWEWMEPIYTTKGQPLRCEGVLEKKNPVGCVGYVQPLQKGRLRPVASFAVAANVRGGLSPTNAYPEGVTCLGPGHLAFVLSTAKLELTRKLRRFGFTTAGGLAVLHRCVDLPTGCLYGSVWAKVRHLRQALLDELQWEMRSKEVPVLYNSSVADIAWDLFQAIPTAPQEATLSEKDGVLDYLADATVNLLEVEPSAGQVHQAFLPVADWNTLVKRPARARASARLAQLTESYKQALMLSAPQMPEERVVGESLARMAPFCAAAAADEMAHVTGRTQRKRVRGMSSEDKKHYLSL